MDEDCEVQQHQQNTQPTAMYQEPSSAHSTLQPDQEMDDAVHDVRNGEDDDGSANGDAIEPQRAADASEPMQRRSSTATHDLVGASSSQDVTVNPLGRGHRRRTQREFFTGIVRDTPKPAAQRTPPPAGLRTQTWEGTYMTPHKARRGALRYAIRVGAQLVEKIRTSDGTDQQ